MNSCYGFARKTLFTLLVFVLALTEVTVGRAKAEGVVAAPSDDAYVYYVSNGDLYRVRTDGSPAQKIRENFDGVKLKPAGNYLYYLYDATSTTLLRLSLTDDKAKISNFGGDKRILHYITEGDLIYYMDDKGGIYRASANAERSTDGTLIADMADTNFPRFTVVSGRVYYNALKNGRTWVASKAADGSGTVQWIASGAFPGDYFAHTYNNTLYLMVDTKPAETTYSLNSMVLYTLPAGGGNARAVNAKAPLDANSVLSGSWAGDYYLFNKGIRLDSNDDYDYSKGKGILMDRTGKFITLNQTGVYEIVNLGSNKFAYVDGKDKAYVSTIANGKVTSTKKLPLANVGYVRNLMNGGKVRSTVLFAESGAYVLNSNLTLTKMVGVEWDLCVYEDDIAGIFYINASDNGRLYRMSEDGKTTVKLSDDKVSRIVLISKN
ncbi:DUF5050 domain-containing protein [Paenibacillus durus]|uniref:Prolow-density lipoprotein receptor-related protein 1-like beta-propeller domain-containing protein n=1 Tax=Paenibacillus durus ATCC 35681 TaxID=1333534 RepID=A0A0F7F8S6_PAEDU|nr:DUF5050 domain-containing protein [Paenibacillus durus]AKG34632.1 hypothetical protein VK70_08610 [Paenibacillus durus ATCC 35681]